MNTLPSIAALGILCLIGCDKPSVTSTQQLGNVFVGTGTNWAEVGKLDTAAQTHLRKRYPDFDPTGAEVTVTIDRGMVTNAISILYFRNFGLPAYTVEFDTNGNIIHSATAIATEGVSKMVIEVVR